ncbi:MULTISPECIES: GNAT family N-acetyltransferase [unclassified Streptomyces]|uniref:GNAT family N-acetyltransferase n=1 Tax=unclassified Streptomyces TaxID=2593676 RepID=UPI001907E6DC|nr:GNAT family N-acetyltransferase [Streptomyces sp. HSG2]
MDIDIRRASPAEHLALGEITTQAYLVDGHLDFGSEDPYLSKLRDVAGRADSAEVLVAVDGAELLGGVTLALAGGPMAELATEGEAEIRMLATTPAARRRGVGEALVRACLESARESGRLRVVLSTQPSMHAAHRLYERLGFVRAPGRDWNPLPERDGFRLIVYETSV